jgi:hypothetical protein
MSILIERMSAELAAYNTQLVNPMAVVAILALLFLLAWRERLRVANAQANQKSMELLDVAIVPLSCIFLLVIVLRMLTFL